MGVIKRASAPDPTPAKQTVLVEALGGDVVVRGLMLVERLAVQNRLASMSKAARERAPGQPYDPAQDLNVVIPILLSMTVLDADNLPVYTEQQWQIFGGKHASQALALFNVAWDLAGLNESGIQKN